MSYFTFHSKGRVHAEAHHIVAFEARTSDKVEAETVKIIITLISILIRKVVEVGLYILSSYHLTKSFNFCFIKPPLAKLLIVRN